MKKTKDNNEYINQTMLLKRNGWTAKAVKLFLPTPDKETTNPRYKNASPQKMYLLSTIEKIEDSEAFLLFLEGNNKRTAAAQKAVETKRRKIMDYVNNIKIEVPIIEKTKLLNDSITHYNEYQEYLFYNKGGYKKQDQPFLASTSSDALFLKRITLNYLRHNLTNYEDELTEIFGKTGTDEAYDVLKERINKAILTQYNWLI